MYETLGRLYMCLLGFQWSTYSKQVLRLIVQYKNRVRWKARELICKKKNKKIKRSRSLVQTTSVSSETVQSFEKIETKIFKVILITRKKC